MSEDRVLQERVEGVARQIRAEVIISDGLLRRGLGGAKAEDGPHTLEQVLAETLRRVYGGSHAQDGHLPETAPFALKLVPTLADVADKQLRLVTKVMCAVSTRPVVTVHELEEEITMEEGVACFADLGFGRHLQCLPLVQQYFQVTADMDILPVTSGQLIVFLLGEQHTLSVSACDTRSLLNDFRSFYEATYLNTTSEPHSRRRYLHNNRQLGLHIQSLPWLLTSLRQAAAERTAAMEKAVHETKVVLQKNLHFYTEVVRALDQKLLASTAAGVFTVAMAEQAARRTSVPLHLWQDAAHGGVALAFSVGHGDGAGSQQEKGSVTSPGVVKQQASQREAGGASVPHPPPLTPVLVPAASATCPPLSTMATPTGRRRRGPLGSHAGHICDEGAVVSVLAVNPVPVPVAPPLAQRPTASQPLPHSEEISPATAGTVSAAKWVGAESPIELLHKYVKGTLDLPADALIREVLSKLTVGQTLHCSLLRSAFDKLAEKLKEEDGGVPQAVVSEPFIPVLHPTRPGSGSGSDTVEMVALARVSDVLWDHDGTIQAALSTSVPAIREAVERFLPLLSGNSLFYLPQRARRVVAQLQDRSVESFDAVAPWLFSCDVVKRVTDMRAVSDPSDFSSQFLRAMAFYFESVFSWWVSQLSGAGADSAAAYQRFFDALAVRAAQNAVPQKLFFPCGGAWRCPADGLFVGGRSCFGYSDVLLRPRREPSQRLPELPVLRWRDEGGPSFVVVAVWKAFGVPLLEESVSRRVSFDSLRHSDSALLLHKAVVVLTPFAQRALAQLNAAFYSLIYAPLARRLATFRVVLGKDARLTEALMPTGLAHHSALSPLGTVHTHTRTVRLTYVASHSTLYGEDADCSPAVVAEALCDLFLPASPLSRDAHLRETLYRLLECLVRAFFSHVEMSNRDDGAPCSFGKDQTFTHELLTHEHSPAETRLVSALQEEVARWCSREALPCDLATSLSPSSADSSPLSGALPPFAVAPTPPLKRQLHFPPGCDGLGQPPLRVACRRRGGAGEGNTVWPSPLTSVPWSTASSSVLAHGQVSRAAQGLAQWQCPFFVCEAADALSRALSTLRGREGPDTAEISDDEDIPPGKRPRPATRRIESRSAPRLALAQEEDDGSFLSTRPRTFVAADGTSTANDTTAAAKAAERFVYENVKRLYEEKSAEARSGGSAGGPCFEVVWMNEHDERGTAYDIVILRYPNTRSRETRANSHVVEYVEVKSTTSSDRKDFELSLRELLMAARYGVAYKIYRVFGASTSPMRKMRFRIYEDILTLWYTGKLTLTGNIHATPSF